MANKAQADNRFDRQQIGFVEGVLHKAIELAQADPENGHAKKSAGGYFCVRDFDGTLNVLVRIGEVTAGESAERQMTFAQEKTMRIHQNPGHVSSWQSRDPDADPPRYGGGIKTQIGYISFSGLPELWDEAAMVVLGLWLGILEDEESDAITAISQNKKIRQLLSKVGITNR